MPDTDQIEKDNIEMKMRCIYIIASTSTDPSQSTGVPMYIVSQPATKKIHIVLDMASFMYIPAVYMSITWYLQCDVNYISNGSTN